ncbi:flagellin [Roseomonas sp. OT10]|uniref:flagellin n=1 Tax=Roseomonas cutis TaxID=2897332 RepID=UPI001E4947FE|nr:flagellin [Roseomonas sp. OT10]UFN48296.1 flagellin [Roseomonas sp. OT10]
MASINTNAAAMAAVRSLSTISRDMLTTQSRVESGLRVNKANDDPAVFAIAQNMRADLNAMSAVKDSLAFGKQALTVARDAATSISDELGKLKQTVTQGQQQGLDVAQINAQITNALQNIDAFARTATFNGVNLLTQGVAGVPGVTGNNLDIVRDINGTRTSVAGTNSTTAGLSLTGLQAASGARMVSFGAAFAPAAGDTLSVTVGGTTHTFEISDGTTALATTPTATNKVYDVQTTAADSPLTVVSKLITRMQGEGLDAQLDTNGALVIRGNATAVTATFASGGATVSTVPTGTAAITAIEGAIDLMGTRLASIGASLRQVEGLSEFTVKLNDSIKEGLGALVDADLAEESARLTSLQTKQQLATQSLSIANQQSQTLLSLFRG